MMRARAHPTLAAVLVAVATLAVAGCDDGPTTLAKGEEVELVGNDGLGGETLNITAEEKDGEVTGEFRVTDVVVRVGCAETDTDGVVILGGEVTNDPDLSDNDEPDRGFGVGALLALMITEGGPDRVALLANVDNAGSCSELLESMPRDGPTVESNSAGVEDGYDIDTG
jgi:hypothetical protein